MGHYLLASVNEENLSSKLGAEWFKKSDTETDYAIQMYKFAKNLLGKNKNLLLAFPELTKLNLGSDYPTTDTQLTNNLFSVLAYEFANSLSSSAVRGAVNTPYELAYDMVALSIAIKLQHINGAPISTTYKSLKNGSLSEDLAKQVTRFSWLDPCVGTGVFPLAITNLVSKISNKADSQPEIIGWDIDPIAIEATKIRLALRVSKGRLDNFEEIYKRISPRYRNSNALEHQGIQNSLFNDSQNRQADIVIGNPPYVKANRLTLAAKKNLGLSFPNIYTGSTDLYVYFIAGALNEINSSGVVCFVSPAHFTRSNYGKLIREYISKNASLDVYFDFNELEVFKDVSSHICVYGISKQHDTPTLSYLFSSLNRDDYLIDGIDNFSAVPRGNISAHAWNMHTFDVADVIGSAFRNCVPLKQVVGNIYSGIKTGRQSVFAINDEAAAKMLKDSSSKKYISPYIPPRQIKRWKTPKTKEYLIVIKRGEIVPEESVLMGYLRKNKKSLESRDDVEKYERWYSLRDCSYYDLFKKPKIIYPDISSNNRFSLDLDGRYITDGAFFLPTDDPFILGVLNSNLAHFYFKLRLSGLGTAGSGGRIRFKKVYVEDFPVPKLTKGNKHLRDAIADLVSRSYKNFTETQQTLLDELVYNLYQVKSEIRTLVEEKIHDE